jgi:hypothetical protein
METMLSPIREGIDVLVSRLPVLVKTTLQDNWVCDYSSVLSILSHAVETHYVRNLNQESPGKAVRCRVVTVHGWGVTGKTTACKMIANDEKCAPVIQARNLWVKLGETASCDALVERLAFAVKLSGGEKAAESISRLMDPRKFELAKVEFHHWFDSREFLFILDKNWDFKDHGFNQWMDVIREISGGKCFLLCSSRLPLGQKNVEFSELNKE